MDVFSASHLDVYGTIDVNGSHILDRLFPYSWKFNDTNHYASVPQ